MTKRIGNLITDAELVAHVSLPTVLGEGDYYTKQQSDNKYSPKEHNHNSQYQPVGEYETNISVNNKISSHNNDITTHKDIRDKIPTKTSQLSNDSGFITNIPSEYITEIEMANYAEPKNSAIVKDVNYVHTDNNYTDLDKTEVNKIKNKADTIHNHDDIYYSETEINDKLSKKLEVTNIKAGDNVFLDVIGNDITINSTSGGGIVGDITWNDIQNKPTDYPPSSHQHNEYEPKNDNIQSHIVDTTIHVTSIDKQNWNNKSNFSGNYNDLINKPYIPVVDITKAYVDSELDKKSNIHTHPYANSVHSHSYNDLSEKPIIPIVDVDKKYVDEKLSTKVDKVDGKGLSTNDYTTAEKNKLSGLNNYSHPVTKQCNYAYDLPIATSSVLGGVKQGSNVTISDDGTISANVSGSEKTINNITQTNGAISLETNKTYKVTLSGNTTITLPDVNNGIVNEILLYANITANLVIEWGTNRLFVDSKIPIITSGKSYRFVFEYEPNLNKWIIGSVESGVA